jgi:hypothetical protein
MRVASPGGPEGDGDKENLHRDTEPQACGRFAAKSYASVGIMRQVGSRQICSCARFVASAPSRSDQTRPHHATRRCLPAHRRDPPARLFGQIVSRCRARPTDPLARRRPSTLDGAPATRLATSPAGPAAVKAGILSSHSDNHGRLVENDPRRFGFHNLHHSVASFLIRIRTDPKTVQTLLRHSDVKLTLQFYTHAVSRDRMVAAGKMLTAIFSHAPDKNGTDSGLNANAIRPSS